MSHGSAMTDWRP